MRGRLTRTRTAAVVGVAAVAAAFPAAAGAHRSASRAQADALVYQSSGRYYGGGSVSEPRSAPLRCFTADISTVAGGGRWGAWTFSRYAFERSHQSLCHTGNGVVIEHLIGARWYVLWEGSEGYPPTHDTRIGSFEYRGVPRAVARDLERGLS